MQTSGIGGAAVKFGVAAAATFVVGIGLALSLLTGGTAGVVGSYVSSQDSCTVASSSSDPAEGPGQTFTSGEPSQEAVSGIPANYLEAYRAAGEEYGIDWTYLAGIGKVETDHGRYNPSGGCITGPQTAYGSAQGPMQFIPSTWETVGVDGDGDGVKDPCNYKDAIPAAANYLKQSGAPQDYYAAVFAYNHADWYVDEVFSWADKYRAADAGGGSGGTGGGQQAGGDPGDAFQAGLAAVTSPFAMSAAHAQEADPQETPEATTPQQGTGAEPTSAVFPLPAEYQDDYSDDWGASRPGGRGHEGTDIFAPEGTAITSVTDGEVVRSGWDELGGWTVMVEASRSVGPVRAGDTLYYAHQVEKSPLTAGTRVEAGEQIGKVGTTGYGPPGSSTGTPNHLHLGWYTDGSRAEAESGAMNPFPLLQWLEQNGGTVSGGEPGAEPLQPTSCEGDPREGVNGGAPLGEVPGDSGGGDSGGGGSAASGSGAEVIAEAKKYIGTPYVLGGSEDCIPYEAMDCTCLTTTVFRKFGYELPDAPLGQWEYGEPVQGEPQAGDLLIWDDPGDGTGGHAAISMGDGNIIHANMGTMDTDITPHWDTPLYLGARRLVE